MPPALPLSSSKAFGIDCSGEQGFLCSKQRDQSLIQCCGPGGLLWALSLFYQGAPVLLGATQARKAYVWFCQVSSALGPRKSAFLSHSPLLHFLSSPLVDIGVQMGVFLGGKQATLYILVVGQWLPLVQAFRFRVNVPTDN